MLEIVNKIKSESTINNTARPGKGTVLYPGYNIMVNGYNIMVNGYNIRGT